MTEFSAYGPSHWTVLAVAVLGAVGLVYLGRHGRADVASRCGHALAIALVLLNLGTQIWAIDPARIVYGLPLHLSDLAPYVSAYALWSRRTWAYALTYYWGITLSSQALLTPALEAPDFPGLEFLAFFAIHLLVVWAAIYLTWGLGLRPGWRGYWLAVTLTVSWAVCTFAVNAIAGTNYGFLNGKPATGSLLDVLGPWPWYLIPEAALVLGVWALMTAPWTRSRSAARARGV